MAGTFRPRPSQPDASGQPYTHSQPAHPGFPASPPHDDSGYDAAGYEPGEREHRRRPSDAAQHVVHSGMHMQTSPIQHTHFTPPTAAADGASPDQFRMLPPSNSTHTSWQALYDYAQSHAAAEGYALSINTTAKNRSRIKLACVCYGQPKNTHKLTAETRIRKNRVSYKTGCKMWVEGKKREDGSWLLRVGEPQHNHPGRPSEGWAAQRKRTWGMVGGRIGVGGVTAQEEARMSGMNKSPTEIDHGIAGGNDDEKSDGLGSQDAQKTNHLRRGGLVWKIVEQDMLRTGEPCGSRDGSVDRTVAVLQARLPGIHIFKRDVYNIRATIKRAWKSANRHTGECEDEGAEEEEEEEEEEPQDETVAEEDDSGIEKQPAKSSMYSQPEYHQHTLPLQIQTRDFALDPSLDEPAQPPSAAMSTTQVLSASSAEVEQLRTEVARLKTLLGGKTKEVMEKDIIIAGLRSQLDYMNSLSMLSG